jgi:hypothetical protein
VIPVKRQVSECGGTESLRLPRKLSVRVSAAPYLCASSALFFGAVWCFRSGNDSIACGLWICSFVVVPLLSRFERVQFDGIILERSGCLAFLVKIFRGRRLGFTVQDVEHVETSALRALRTSGRIYYRYRTSICAGRENVVIVSGGSDYRLVVRELLSRIDPIKLDQRSTELTKYLIEPAALSSAAAKLNLPSADILDTVDSLRSVRSRPNGYPSGEGAAALDATEFERSQALRTIANQLRISGRLRESAEAFRRSLKMRRDGWTELELGRLLRSLAGSSRSIQLSRRSVAALRLAWRSARQDAALRLRIAESFAEFGEFELARGAYNSIQADDPLAYRAYLGLASLALKEGKIAHVVHQFNAAASVTSDEAARRYSMGEASYFARLNDDEGYLGRELARINLLRNSERVRSGAARILVVALTLALVGPVVAESAAGFGWSLTAVAASIWVLSLSATKRLRRRSRLDLGT